MEILGFEVVFYAYELRSFVLIGGVFFIELEFEFISILNRRLKLYWFEKVGVFENVLFEKLIIYYKIGSKIK